MARILIAYSTVDGRTRAISERLQQSLEDRDHSVMLISLSDAERPNIRLFDKVAIGASIRYGRYRPEVYEFIRLNQQSLQDRPSAFFSVNVVARKPGRETPDANPYTKNFSRKTNWQPALIAVFAGKIDYQKYAFLDRHLIRLIMWLTHGPTDPRECIDFTNWESVDTFARRIALLEEKKEYRF